MFALKGKVVVKIGMQCGKITTALIRNDCKAKSKFQLCYQCSPNSP